MAGIVSKGFESRLAIRRGMLTSKGFLDIMASVFRTQLLPRGLSGSLWLGLTDSILYVV